MDFSVLIFIIIWSSFLLVIIRSIQQPVFFLALLASMVLLTIVRIATIYLVVLDPPEGLIKLQDPLTSLTYGGRGIFITKDLFFSGHTSNLFMFYLCLQKKRDKIFVLLGTITVGILVLVQHVHYSMDVIGAFIITFILVKVVKNWLGFK
jgi:membrane-associated phospholipid phosphatase